MVNTPFTLIRHGGRRLITVACKREKTDGRSEITAFDELLQKAQSKAPTRCLVSIDDVGVAVAFLAMNGAKLVTGETLYIDGGYHIID